jgi:hypothetical protein
MLVLFFYLIVHVGEFNNRIFIDLKVYSGKITELEGYFRVQLFFLIFGYDLKVYENYGII